MSVVVRTLYHGPLRIRIRSQLFFLSTLGGDGRTHPLPALANALAEARAIRRRTGRPVWIESAAQPAYVRAR